MDDETKALLEKLVATRDEGPAEEDCSWRVVDAQCSQLRDSVRGAQYPMLLALIWGFAWMVALYNHDYGYTRNRLASYQELLSQIDHGTNVLELFTNSPALARYYLRPNDATGTQPMLSAEVITNALKEQETELLKQQVELWQFTFPGTALKITVFDLGIVGCGGMILVYSWFFYAARRENHAIKSFLDMRDTAAKDRWFPRWFVLEPKLRYLSAQHYAYAYHAVAHRFLFLFSTRSGPLLGSTIFLMSFPFLIAVWNDYTDFRDFFCIYLPAHEWSPRLPRVLISAVLLVILGGITRGIIRLAINTSILLNGWYLANRDCWAKALTTPLRQSVGPVSIDRDQQEAKLCVGETEPDS